MIDDISKLKKYENDDIIIVKIIIYLENICNNSVFNLNILESIVKTLNKFKEDILNSEISQKRKNKILSILNNIILWYNDKLMDQIFKNI